MVKDIDYGVRFLNNVNAGIAQCYVTGTGNYTGSLVLSYNIAACDISEKATVSLEQEVYEYDGTNQMPDVTVCVGEKTLEQGTDYVVEYSNNRLQGTATATIKGIANYCGTVKKGFQIVVTKTPVVTQTPTSKPTQTPTSKPTQTPSNTPAQQITEKPSATPTQQATINPEITPTQQVTSKPEVTQVASTPDATRRPVMTRQPYITQKPTNEPDRNLSVGRATSTPKIRATQTPAVKKTATPTATATKTPGAQATATPAPSGMNVSVAKITMYLGGNMNAPMVRVGTSIRNVVSDNNNVVEVLSTGELRAKKKGFANIYASVIDSNTGAEKRCLLAMVTVKNASLKIKNISEKIKPGTSLLLKVKKQGVQGAVKWKSSRPAVATINRKGLLKTKKQGVAVISVSCGGKVKKYKIRVAK